MERWKSRGGKSQGGEVKKWEDQRRERVGSKKMQVREKVGKPRFTVFFHFWKFRCRKSARRFGAKHISKSKESKTFKNLRSQTTFGSWALEKVHAVAYFQVKMHKAHHVRTTFGSWAVEKVHGVVARSTFPSQNAQNTPFYGKSQFLMAKSTINGHFQ